MQQQSNRNKKKIIKNLSLQAQQIKFHWSSFINIQYLTYYYIHVFGTDSYGLQLDNSNSIKDRLYNFNDKQCFQSPKRTIQTMLYSLNYKALTICNSDVNNIIEEHMQATRFG